MTVTVTQPQSIAQLANLWPSFRHLMPSLAEITDRRFTPDQLTALIMRGDVITHLIQSTEPPGVGIIISSVSNYPTSRVMDISGCVTDKGVFDAHTEQIVKSLVEWARGQQINTIQFEGRKGWGRQVSAHVTEVRARYIVEVT